MTPSPYTIDSSRHLVNARRLLSELKVHHLPVVDKRGLVGVLSERDLRTAEHLYRDRSARDVYVRDLTLGEVYTVQETASLGEVVRALFRKKIGSALVLKGKKLAGIFTVTDALALFDELLSTEKD